MAPMFPPRHSPIYAWRLLRGMGGLLALSVRSDWGLVPPFECFLDGRYQKAFDFNLSIVQKQVLV